MTSLKYTRITYKRHSVIARLCNTTVTLTTAACMRQHFAVGKEIYATGIVYMRMYNRAASVMRCDACVRFTCDLVTTYIIRIYKSVPIVCRLVGDWSEQRIHTESGGFYFKTTRRRIIWLTIKNLVNNGMCFSFVFYKTKLRQEWRLCSVVFLAMIITLLRITEHFGQTLPGREKRWVPLLLQLKKTNKNINL